MSNELAVGQTVYTVDYQGCVNIHALQWIGKRSATITSLNGDGAAVRELTDLYPERHLAIAQAIKVATRQMNDASKRLADLVAELSKCSSEDAPSVAKVPRRIPFSLQT